MNRAAVLLGRLLAVLAPSVPTKLRSHVTAATNPVHVLSGEAEACTGQAPEGEVVPGCSPLAPVAPRSPVPDVEVLISWHANPADHELSDERLAALLTQWKVQPR